MVSLRSSCYRFLWGIVARNPFACAKLARTLCKIQDVWNLQGSKLHATVASMAYYHSKSMTSIQSLVCLNWLYLCKPEGRHQANNASNGTRHPSRLVPLCCVTLFVVYFSVSIFYVISGLRETCAYMSLREACEKLARAWRHSILKNKFHRILKSIAGSFECGSLGHSPQIRSPKTITLSDNHYVFVETKKTFVKSNDQLWAPFFICCLP